jgi:hypothetical protein
MPTIAQLWNKISIYHLAGLEIISLLKLITSLGLYFLTFDLEGWPSPFTTQNVQLHEIHMHAKYQVAIFDIAKVMAHIKVFGRTHTHRQTDKRTDSTTAICHPTGSIKMYQGI